MTLAIMTQGCATDQPANSVGPSTSVGDVESGLTTVRRANTTVDYGLIASSRVGDVVTLDDVDGRPIRTFVRDIEGDDDFVTLQVEIVDPAPGFGVVTYDVARRVVRADLDMGGEKLYVIRPEGLGHVVEELERRLGLEAGHEIEVSRRVFSKQVSEEEVRDPSYVFYTRSEEPEESGQTIDLLVAYTQSVESRVGFDERDLALLVRNNLSALEGAIRDSGVRNTRFNITRVVDSTYTETGADNECPDMINLVANNMFPGIDVDALQRGTRADIVMVVATRCRTGTTNRTGLAANVNGSSDYGNTDNGIVVTDIDSMAGAGLDATAHEIGHILGAAHNVEQGQASGYHADSFGYCSRSSGARSLEDFRTIMSYSCGASSSLPTVPRFSSEGGTIERLDSSGAVVSMSTGNGNQDNARALEVTRKKAANFVRRRSLVTANVHLLSTVLDG